MAVGLLMLFFVLLLFNTRLAFVALAAAIVLLYRDRSGGASRPRQRQRQQVSDDASI